MTGYQTAQILYLALLGAAVVGWFFAQNRANWGKITQQAMIWAFIFVGVIAGVGLWGDISRTIQPQQSVISEGVIELPKAPDGHFYATVEVNGEPIRFMVDTGATAVVMTKSDAKTAGLDVDTLAFIGRANTANGTVGTAPVRLESISLGGVTDRNFRAYVNEGEMDHSLLGMSYLGRFSRVEIQPDRLLLTR